MSTKNPTIGTKVDLGQDAPVVKEGAGKVPSESLANESIQEGGDFTSNRGVPSENTSSSDQTSSASQLRGSGQQADQSSEGVYTSKTRDIGHDSSSSQPEGVRSHDSAAPTYVSSQHQKGSSGPHGKNSKEGDWDESKAEDGLKKALEAEPGSINDPSRLAEQQFQLKQGAGGRDTGPKEYELATKTAYDALGSEVSS